MSIQCIRKNNEDTEYTKNIKINRVSKLMLGIPLYKEDKVEMEFIITQIVNYSWTVVFSIASLHIDIQPKTIGICYFGTFFIVIIGCLIYRFKKDDFKESKDHYE